MILGARLLGYSSEVSYKKMVLKVRLPHNGCEARDYHPKDSLAIKCTPFPEFLGISSVRTLNISAQPFAKASRRLAKLHVASTSRWPTGLIHKRRDDSADQWANDGDP